MRFGTYYRIAIIKKLKLDEIISSLDSWLDIGCYGGEILQAIDSKQKVGIDLEVRKQDRLHVIKAKAEFLPFKEKVFDVITAFDVLEHIKDDAQVIEQVENRLGRNGSFIMTVPHEKEKIFPKFLKNWLIFKKWGHLRAGYNVNSLKSLFKKNWRLTFIFWNTDLSNLLYLPLQFIWRTFRRLSRAIINKLIQIEFIRTKKKCLNQGHIIAIAHKQED